MTILVAVGGKSASGKLVETGEELATAYGDDLNVLHVIPQDDAEEHFEELRKIPEFRDVGLSVQDERAREIARTLVREALSEDYDRSRVTPIGRIGDPAEQILAAADQLDARYVVVGGRKRSPAGKALFGSVTQSVLLNADVPTITVMDSS